MKADRYMRGEIIDLCTIDKKRCNRPPGGTCIDCKKAAKAAAKTTSKRRKSKDFKAGYQQALDDIRWGRCKHKNFEYHARARSREDRIAEIRAIDKETLKGGGNIPQE